MVYRMRTQWDQYGKGAMTKLFLTTCDTPRPRSQGVCFVDKYLDVNFQEKAKSPSNDCYFHTGNFFEITQAAVDETGLNLDEIREGLRMFLHSFYYKNDACFHVKLAFLKLSWLQMGSGKWIHELDDGGTGKGMEAVLDANVCGAQNSTTLDFAVFTDRTEMRKSGHFALGKVNVRIPESKCGQAVEPDIWKRFPVGDSFDLRVNYGFTVKGDFETSMKTQEVNFTGLHVVEHGDGGDQVLNHIERRVVAFLLGKATLVATAAEVDHSQGRFLLRPQDDLKTFLKWPVVGTVYFRDWLLPFFLEVPTEQCKAVIQDLRLVGGTVFDDTRFLALKLGGTEVARPGAELEDRSQADKHVLSAFDGTPMKRIIKAYLITQVRTLPGLAAMHSSKGKRTKLEIFDKALSNTKLILFRQISCGNYAKLMVRYGEMTSLIEKHGGAAVFGDWDVWGDTFSLKDKQELPSPDVSDEEAKAFTKDAIPPVSTIERPCREKVASIREIVHLADLEDYAALDTDRRQSQLQAFITHVKTYGTDAGEGVWFHEAEYFRSLCYGRWIAGTPSAQHLTREARFIALGRLCAEVDAPCCFPRLLRKRLMQMGAWSTELFFMVHLFCRFPVAWRAFVGEYCVMPTADAKLQLIKLFFGCRINLDIPFLRSLAFTYHVFFSCVCEMEEER